MKVLMLHNRYRVPGGEDGVFDAERALLTSRGHQIAAWIEDNHGINDASAWRVGFQALWSRKSYRLARRMIRELRPDLVHIHNFFPLISPAAHHAAKTEGIPVVQTLHNYRLFCTNGLFYRGGRICEDCVRTRIPWPGVVHACYRGSRPASAAVATMQVTHRLLHTWRDKVDVYVALNGFVREALIRSGLPAAKIFVKPNFVYPDPGPGTEREGYALFVGRLSAEKGLDTLLAAWARVGGRLALKIVGDGPLAGHVAAAAARMSGVEWLKLQPPGEVYRLMGGAMTLVFPSEWYEVCPRVLIEALAKGTPVIAAHQGAAAEMVDHGRTGLHFRRGDPEDLAEKVLWLLAHPDERRRMHGEARAEFETKYRAERNYEQLMEIYARAVNGPH